MKLQFLFELLELGSCWQFSVKEQIAYLDVGTVGRKVFNSVSSVEQFSFFTIDIGELRAAAARAHESRIIGEIAGLSK